MSKELTPLEWLNYYKKKLQVSGQTIRPNGFDIIETALKENQGSKDKLEELLTTIEEKQKSAESQLLGNHDLDKRERLKGEIEAYYDVICLIKFKYGVEKWK